MMPTGAERRIIDLVRAGEWEIDEHGNVWRVMVRSGDRGAPGTFRLNPCVRRRAEKRLPSGYLMVRAMFNGHRVVGLAHRLVWQAIHGDIPENMVINHKNGLKDDNRPDNLEVVTYSENTKHAYRVGLIDEHGERNPSAKLSDHEIGAIRAAYAAGGVTMDELGRRFMVSLQHISKIIRGERRPKQAGPTSVNDHRHLASERDSFTGRFIGPTKEVAR